MRRELATMLGVPDPHTLLMSDRPTDDGSHSRELRAAHNGLSRWVRYSEDALMLDVDEFTERYLEPLASALQEV